MPTVEHFLDIFEAMSRKDWKDIQNIADNVAEYERKKKHYAAATKIKEAVAIALANNAYDDSFIMSSQIVSAPPIDLLKKDSFDVSCPSVPQWLTQELNLFFDEWGQRELLHAKGIFPRNTILFHGPPGCGKTMLARYVAKRMDRDLYIVRFDALVSSYLGETGENIRKIFDFAKTNRCILFLDEIDAIAKLRDDRSELGELKRVVISLLQNIDSLSPESLLIAATNHAHMLDSAIWRRFDIVWEMLPPKDELRIEFFRRDFGEFLIDPVIKTCIVDVTKGMSGAELTRTINESKKRRILNPALEIIEAFLLAMIDHSRRGEYSESSDRADNKLVEVIEYLRMMFKKKYTYNKLEEITGIPHSTLHHKIKSNGND